MLFVDVLRARALKTLSPLKAAENKSAADTIGLMSGLVFGVSSVKGLSMSKPSDIIPEELRLDDLESEASLPEVSISFKATLAGASARTSTENAEERCVKVLYFCLPHGNAKSAYLK